MNARLLIVAAIASSSAACRGGGPLDSPCDGAMTDACRRGANLAALVGIAYADAVAGGSPFLGEADTHGPRRVAVQVRGNTVKSSMPRLDGVSFRTDGSAASTAIQTSDVSTTALSAELAVGVTRGVAIGTNHLFGVDLVGGVSALRDFSGGDMNTTAAMNWSRVGGWNYGSSFGARIGLAEERPLVPGVSFSYVRRTLPRIRVDSRGTGLGNGEPITIRSDMEVHDAGWRLVASKTFRTVGASLGYGGDAYRMTSDNRVTLSARSDIPGKNTTETRLSRRNIFAGAFANIGPRSSLERPGYSAEATCPACPIN